nr:hypothetical protein [Candidatus Accumulibacter aalborgensis]
MGWAQTRARAEIDAALGPVAGAMGNARRIGPLNVVASCLAAMLALWAAVH